MTQLDDRVTVLMLAGLVDDMAPGERAAFRREVDRVIGEVHAQVGNNMLLRPYHECARWDVTTEAGGMFAQPRLSTVRGMHVYRPGDLAASGLSSSRRLTGELCSFPGDHGASCPCAGDGVSRPIGEGRLGVLPGGGWLSLSLFGL